MRLVGPPALAAFVACSGVAAAQPVATLPAAPSAAAAPRRIVRRLEHEEVAAAAPAPDVKLTLEADSPRGAWTMRVTNDSAVPVRLVADARLLTLDVTPRGEHRPVHCQLPADMRLTGDDASAVVLPPGRSYAESLQPVLYCFGGRALEALAQGASVVGHLGFPGERAHAPFVVAPIDGVEPALAPLKRLDAPPIGLPDDPTPPEAMGMQVRPDDPDRVRLTLRGQASADVTSPSSVFVSVTLRNDGKRPVTLRFRPETLRFRVTGPTGQERCRWPMPPVAAMPDLFTTIRPGGSESQTVLLGAYCSTKMLEQPGLLVVVPELDTRHGSGSDIALQTFDGDVVSLIPSYVRLHQGTKPGLLRRPKLVPLPVAPPAAAPSTGPAATPAP